MTTFFEALGGLALRALALAAAMVLPVAYALDPADGDLTRLGGYPENRYGPTAPQMVFAPPLVEAARPGAAYDLVVAGDGFSQPAPGADRIGPSGVPSWGRYWTDHLRNLSGLSVGVIHLDEQPLAAYLASADFRDRPPRVLVVQMTERDLPAHAARAAALAHGAPAPACTLDTDTVPPSAPMTGWSLSKKYWPS